MAFAITAFHALRTLPEQTITDRISRRVLGGDQAMIVWWSMKAGAHAAAHQHPHEQIFWVTSGRMDIRIGSERRVCGPGEMGVIPGGAEHEVWFPEDCEVVDIFAPPREDFRPGAAKPAYMQQA